MTLVQARCVFCERHLLRYWLEPGSRVQVPCRSCRKGATEVVCEEVGGRPTIRVSGIPHDRPAEASSPTRR